STIRASKRLNRAGTSASELTSGLNRPAACRMLRLRSSSWLAVCIGFSSTAALEMNTEHSAHRISATRIVYETELTLDDMTGNPPLDIGFHHKIVDQRCKQIAKQN